MDRNNIGSSGSGEANKRKQKAECYEEVVLLVYPIDKTSGSVSTVWSKVTQLPIRHTAVLVHGWEYDFSQDGVLFRLRRTYGRKPEKTFRMGYTSKSPKEVDAWVNHQKYHNFRRTDYGAVNRNCHHFSNHMCEYLTGRSIPAKFTTMGEVVRARTVTLASSAVATLVALGSPIISFVTFFTPYLWNEWVLPGWRWFKSWFSPPQRNVPQITWQEESELQESDDE